MRRATISILALACLTVGCSILAPERDRSQFFVLRPVTSGGGRAGEGLAVGIGPVRMPGYLARPEIVHRVGEDRLAFSRDQVWGEPLERGFRRVLGENLGQSLGTVEILQFPWSTAMRVDYQIPIEILRFEADESGVVSLHARWAIQRPPHRDLLLTRESRVVETPRDSSTESLVAAMSAAVGSLSDEIVAAIPQVPPRAGRPR